MQAHKTQSLGINPWLVDNIQEGSFEKSLQTQKNGTINPYRGYVQLVEEENLPNFSQISPFLWLPFIVEEKNGQALKFLSK